MILLSEAGKNFIENHAEQIDNNEWSKIYSSEDYEQLAGTTCGRFTRIINSIGIDPLKTLDFVPTCYLAYSTIRIISLYHHIREIHRKAFVDCRQLESVFIPRSVEYIGELAFAGCFNIKDFKYEGTKEEWESIEKEANVFDRNPLTRVRCSDGDFWLKK